MIPSVTQPLKQDLYEVNKDEFDIQNDERGLLERQASAVACMVKKSNLIQDTQTGRYRITPRLLKSDVEPSLGFGTAFMIAGKYACTAAQCVQDTHFPIDATFLVFGFQKDTQGQYPTDFPEEDVYPISKVVTSRFLDGPDGYEDWAILELPRTHGSHFLTLCTNFSATDESLHTIGHYKGTSLKVTSGIKVTSQVGRTQFFCSLSAEIWSPGAPVLSRISGVCVGILYNVSASKHYSRAPCQRVAYHIPQGKEYYGKSTQELQDCSYAYTDMPPCTMHDAAPQLNRFSRYALPGCYLFGRNETITQTYPLFSDRIEYEYNESINPHCKYLGYGEFSLEKSYFFKDAQDNKFALTAIGFYDCAYKVVATTTYLSGLYTDVTVWRGDTEPGKMRHFAFIYSKKEALRSSALAISCSIINLSSVLPVAEAGPSVYEAQMCEMKYAPSRKVTGTTT